VPVLDHLISISAGLFRNWHFVEVPVPLKDRKKRCINMMNQKCVTSHKVTLLNI
jgi:hypothetical protein